jgi:hypothetical protein
LRGAAWGLQRAGRIPAYGARMVAANGMMDLELIAQRVLKLAEIATLEHLQGLLDSQAWGVVAMVEGEKTKDERRKTKGGQDA